VISDESLALEISSGPSFAKSGPFCQF